MNINAHCFGGQGQNWVVLDSWSLTAGHQLNVGGSVTAPGLGWYRCGLGAIENTILNRRTTFHDGVLSTAIYNLATSFCNCNWNWTRALTIQIFFSIFVVPVSHCWKLKSCSRYFVLFQHGTLLHEYTPVNNALTVISESKFSNHP